MSDSVAIENAAVAPLQREGVDYEQAFGSRCVRYRGRSRRFDEA
jgi:hypothetical protein